jgi:hypothetical protein
MSFIVPFGLFPLYLKQLFSSASIFVMQLLLIYGNSGNQPFSVNINEFEFENNAISLFFSVVRPRAGRFGIIKVAKETKYNICKKRLVVDFLYNCVVNVQVL